MHAVQGTAHLLTGLTGPALGEPPAVAAAAFAAVMPEAVGLRVRGLAAVLLAPGLLATTV